MHTSDLICLTEVVPSLHQVSSSDESQYSSYSICTLFGLTTTILYFIHSYCSSVVNHGVISHFPTIFTSIYPISISWGSKIPQGVSARRNIFVGLTCSPSFSLPSHGKTNTFHAEINLIQQSFDSSALASPFTASSITNKS